MSAKAKAPQACSAIKWLEHNDKELYEALNALCVLRNMGGKSTFVVPGSSVRKEIIDGAMSGETGPTERAALLACAHMVRANLPAPESWQNDIGSAAKIRLVVEKVTASKVTLAGGVELEKHNSNPRTGAEFSIWAVKKGEMPTTGDAYEMKPGGKKGGGGRRGGASAVSGRLAITEIAEAEYRAGLKVGQMSTAYISRVYALLLHLKLFGGTTYIKAMSVADFDPIIAFYILVQPHATPDHYIIPEELMFGSNGWNGAAITPTTDAWFGLFKSYHSEAPKCASTSSRSELNNAIDKLRTDVNGGTANDAVDIIKAAYQQLAESNTIKGVQGSVLPVTDSTTRDSMHRDEFRFTLHLALEDLYCTIGSGESVGKFAAIVNSIKSCYPCKGANPYQELVLMSRCLVSDVAGRGRTKEQWAFIHSTDLLYTPENPDTLKIGLPSGLTDVPTADMESSSVYSRNFVTMRDVSRQTTPSAASEGRIISAMANVRL